MNITFESVLISYLTSNQQRLTNLERTKEMEFNSLSESDKAELLDYIAKVKAVIESVSDALSKIKDSTSCID